jgi:hypothetical protein
MFSANEGIKYSKHVFRADKPQTGISRARGRQRLLQLEKDIADGMKRRRRWCELSGGEENTNDERVGSAWGSDLGFKA